MGYGTRREMISARTTAGGHEGRSRNLRSQGPPAVNLKEPPNELGWVRPRHIPLLSCVVPLRLVAFLRAKRVQLELIAFVSLSNLKTKLISLRPSKTGSNITNIRREDNFSPHSPPLSGASTIFHRRSSPRRPPAVLRGEERSWENPSTDVGGTPQERC